MSDFDSDRFVIEVEQRPAIWDLRCNAVSYTHLNTTIWKEKFSLIAFKEENNFDK